MDNRTNHKTTHAAGKEDGDGAAAKVCDHAGENDVLLGRGKGAYNHEGNVTFRRLVIERSTSYRQNDNKSFRRAVAREIIKDVERRGGKFLRPLEPTTSRAPKEYPLRYEIVPASLALTKVKQALRDMAVATLHEPKPKSAKPEFTTNKDTPRLQQLPPTLNPFLLNSFGGPLLNGYPFKSEPSLLNFLGMSQLNDRDGSQSPDLSQLAALQLSILRKEQTDRLLGALAQQQSLALLQQQQQQVSNLLSMGTNAVSTGQQFTLSSGISPSHVPSHLSFCAMENNEHERDILSSSRTMMFPAATQSTPIVQPLPSPPARQAPPLTEIHDAPLSATRDDSANDETVSLGELNEKITSV